MNTNLNKKFPIHFFTIVLNGMPFIEYHLKEFLKLDIPWCWHIIEGVAALNHDTSWSVAAGGQITEDIHNHGLSNDGTSDYLDLIQKKYPNQIFIYRKKRGFFWDGKKEMVSAPLKNINEECLLWQVDADELWTVDQINNIHKYFLENPEKSAAYYWCWYFVGPNKIISTRFNYAQNPNQEWLRTWKYLPGDRWLAHEPPTLMREINKGTNEFVDVAKINPILHEDTEKIGAVFQHYAYVTEEQIKFKESYYGYKNALADWKKLQTLSSSSFLSRYFKWVSDSTIVDDVSYYPLVPIAFKDNSSNKWLFDHETNNCDFNNNRNPLSFKIAIDGIFWQYQSSGIARVWKNFLLNWVDLGFADNIIVFDRCGSAPKIEGIHYWNTQRHDYSRSAEDSLYLQKMCEMFSVDFFVSTYYTTPISTPSFFMGHDMIPEKLGFPLEDQAWKDKEFAILHSQKQGMVSHNSIKDLCEFYPHLNISNIVYLPNGVDSNIFRATSEDINIFLKQYDLIGKKFILLVGERFGYCGYKNSSLLFEALTYAKPGEYSVVCIGGNDVIEKELVDINPNINVLRLKATDAELRAAYSAAYCLVYPSKYEGFGLPVLEAMACGCPVITCKNSSLVEVAGNAAIFVNESNSFEAFQAIDSLKSNILRANLIRNGYAQVEKFEFKNTAKKLFDAISTMKTTDSISKIYFDKIVECFRMHQNSLQIKLNSLIEVNSQNIDKLKFLEKNREKSPARENLVIEITRTATNHPEILLDRLATTNLMRETGKRIIQYPLRKIKRILPSGVKKLIKKLLNYKQ